MRSVWSWHDPFVVRLVKRLVDKWVMQAAVDPVNTKVCEEDEKGELEDVVQREGRIGKAVVKLRVTAYFGQHASGSQERHDWHGFVCLDNFHANLVLEIFRMLECRFVEHIDV